MVFLLGWDGSNVVISFGLFIVTTFFFLFVLKQVLGFMTCGEFWCLVVFGSNFMTCVVGLDWFSVLGWVCALMVIS